MSFMDLILVVFDIGLLLWILNQRIRIRHLESEIACRPPVPEALSVQDLRRLQHAMMDLVQNLEGYTETQINKMKVQTEAVATLSKRLEQKLQEITPPALPLEEEYKTSRVVPLSPRPGLANHKDKDKIIQLYQQGWTPEKIAEELRITKGEVQLIVNLT